jgi:cell pole-organizing protein PopZ
MEEFVRAELRPLLKTWLDEHLPTIVERLVRAELARLTLRHGG